MEPGRKQIAWFFSPGGNAPRLSISDALGRHVRPLVARPVWGGVWSPDSTSMAYGLIGRHPHGGGHWTEAVNVSTGASHLVGSGFPLAWSPDGKNLALIRQSLDITSQPGTIVSVPIAGGRARRLFRIPVAPSG